MTAQRYEEEQSTIILEGKYTIPKMLTQISDSEDSQDEMSLGQLLDMKSNSDVSHLNDMPKAPIVRTRTERAIKLADKCKIL